MQVTYSQLHNFSLELVNPVHLFSGEKETRIAVFYLMWSGLCVLTVQYTCSIARITAL